MRSSITAFRLAALALLGTGAGWTGIAHAAAEPHGPGLRATAESLPWPRLAARVGLQVGSASLNPSLRPHSVGDVDTDRSGAPLQALNVLGDVYFGSAGRFRATGGVLLGTRALPWPAAMAAGGGLTVGHRTSLTAAEPGSDPSGSGTVPYLGIGYSDAYDRGRWGFTADLGLLALAPQPALRLGRAVTGQQSFDDVLRELRLAPSVQIGVSYAF